MSLKKPHWDIVALSDEAFMVAEHTGDGSRIPQREIVTVEDGRTAALIAAAPEMYNALRVIELTPHIAAYLADRDPNALLQVKAAIASAVVYGV